MNIQGLLKFLSMERRNRMKRNKIKKYTAIFHVKFNPDDMCDKETLEKDFDGDWNKLIKWLYDQEGFGMFDGEFKFVAVSKGGNYGK